MSFSRKVIVTIVFLLVIALATYIFIIQVTNPTSDAPESSTIEISADPQKLKTHVHYLSEIEPERNYKNKDSLEKAADYIKQEFEKYCPVVSEQVVSVNSETYRNIICLFGPKDKERVVVGAHYDANVNSGPASDDNASGVAGLIELARLVKENDPDLQTQLELVSYPFEEPPYFRTESMGSFVHAKALYEQKIKVKYMLSLEMIGYFSNQENSQKIPFIILRPFYPSKGNFIALIGRLGKDGFIKDLKASMNSSGGLQTYSLNAPPYMLTGYSSDQLNYWEFGYDAAIVTDTGPFRNPNYHKATDTPDTLDYEKIAEVINKVYLTITSN